MVSPLIREASVGSDVDLPDSGSKRSLASNILPGERLLARTCDIRLSKGTKPPQEYEAHFTAETHNTAYIRHLEEAALRRYSVKWVG
jgi:hypothetical protein